MIEKALCYVRVSTRSQEEQPRHDQQIRSMDQMCKSNGWDPEVIPECFSAQTIAKRKIFKQILERLARGEAKYLLVHTVDRLCRNQKEGLEIGKMSLTQGWKLVITSQPQLDISRDGDWMMFSIMLMLAENEVRTLSTRVREGTQRAKQMGLPVGGERHPPLDPNIVKKIFYYKYRHFTYKQIADKLNDRGLESVHHTKTSGKAWNKDKVEAVIRRHRRQKSKSVTSISKTVANQVTIDSVPDCSKV